MSFGWSAGDIYQLIVLCHGLASNATLGPASSIQLVNGLCHEIDELEKLLTQLQSLVRDGGETAFFDLKAIELTLRECRQHLTKYSRLKHAYDAHKNSGEDDEGQKARARVFLSRPKNIARAGTELVRHVAYGGTETAALQDRVARHKLSLSLYLSVLERQRTAVMSNRLRSVERMVHELHAETMPQTRLQRVGSIPNASTASLRLMDTNEQDADRYNVMLEAVDRQRQYAMLQRSLAQGSEGPEGYEASDAEWETICDQLDTIHQRLLYVIERESNSRSQHGTANGHSRTGSSYDIALNRALLSNSRGAHNHHKISSASAAHYPSFRRKRHAALATSLSLIRDETETENEAETEIELEPIPPQPDDDEGMEDGGVPLHPPSVAPSTYAASVFSIPASISASTVATEVTTVQAEASSVNPKPMYPTFASQPQASPLSSSPSSHSLSTSPSRPPHHRHSTSSFASTAPSLASVASVETLSSTRGPNVGLARRSTDDSSHHSSCTWKLIELNGKISISWQGHPQAVHCVLSAGFRRDGRLCAIRATVPDNTSKHLPILRLSSSEKRPIPHIDPPGHRDTGPEAVVYFIKPPKTKNGDNPRYIVHDHNDLRELQTLIYGKRLLLSQLVQKVSCPRGKESDRQYLRLWQEIDDEGHLGAMWVMYFAPAREPPRYMEIHQNDVSNPRTSHRTVLELQLPKNQHVKITFCSASDLQLFSETLFRTEGRPEHPPPRRSQRASSLFADGPPASWPSP